MLNETLPTNGYHDEIDEYKTSGNEGERERETERKRERQREMREMRESYSRPILIPFSALSIFTQRK